MADRADRELDAIVHWRSSGLRKCTSRADGASSLKDEAIRLQSLSGESKRACARLFGVPWETCRDWLDPGQPKKHPPEDFVAWLSHRAAARGLVRVA